MKRGREGGGRGGERGGGMIEGDPIHFALGNKMN